MATPKMELGREEVVLNPGDRRSWPLPAGHTWDTCQPAIVRPYLEWEAEPGVTVRTTDGKPGAPGFAHAANAKVVGQGTHFWGASADFSNPGPMTILVVLSEK